MGTKALGSGAKERRRGGSRAVARLSLALVVVAVALSGCGGSDSGSSLEAEKAADAERLNALLARELTLVRAYGPALRLTRGGTLALVARLRGQDQAHADAIVKAIRGVGGEMEAEAEPLELEPPPATRAEALLLVYEAENTALSEDFHIVPDMETGGARGLAGALATNHAQHLVLLRRALGAPAGALIPGAFETGDTPPPAEGR
jgi:hypothetical protein